MEYETLKVLLRNSNFPLSENSNFPQLITLHLYCITTCCNCYILNKKDDDVGALKKEVKIDSAVFTSNTTVEAIEGFAEDLFPFSNKIPIY